MTTTKIHRYSYSRYMAVRTSYFYISVNTNKKGVLVYYYT